jgi:hypothetical protein
MPKDVQSTIVCSNLKDRVVWTVPLIEYFLDHTESLAQMKPHRALVGFASGIALDVQLHSLIVSQKLKNGQDQSLNAR